MYNRLFKICKINLLKKWDMSIRYVKLNLWERYKKLKYLKNRIYLKVGLIMGVSINLDYLP